jgi:hypothetical protein
MRPVAAGRAEAQSSGRIAADYDRLIELNGRKGAEPVDRWLHGLLPATGHWILAAEPGIMRCCWQNGSSMSMLSISPDP